MAVLVIALFSVKLRQKDNEKKIDLTNFEVNPYLESVMRQARQSTGYSVKIFSPQAGENLSGHVHFQWRVFSDEEPDSRALEVKILDNREAIAFSELVQDTGFTFEQRLPPGIYYWTLEDHGEMLYLGKFYVNKPGSLEGDQ